MIGIFLAMAAQMEAAPVAATQAYRPSAAQGPLQLTCVGGGIANKEVTDTIKRDKKVDGPPGSTPTTKTETTTVSRMIQQDYADQVELRLFMGDDRIRMPRIIVPDLHGGNKGWYKLKDIAADANTIRGTAALAFLVTDKVFIDRLGGTISITGKYGNFTGRCHVPDPNAPRRF